MARGFVEMKLVARLPGAFALALVLALAFGSLAAILARSEGLGRITPTDWAALRFTLVQAFLSAALSTLLAIPVARALARRRFA
ncbi:MAG: thiamine/thiamine pyrophosphate ABC transporter permease ThiP, partial [Rhodobacteraceae bacterium]|nr:thiamine/thiamine pyrophosphate ABC transporter permease ThiP [Paracoccaceae bacterium]